MNYLESVLIVVNILILFFLHRQEKQIEEIAMQINKIYEWNGGSRRENMNIDMQ